MSTCILHENNLIYNIYAYICTYKTYWSYHVKNKAIFHEILALLCCGDNNFTSHIRKLHCYERLITVQYYNPKMNPIEKYLHRNGEALLHQPCVQRPV